MANNAWKDYFTFTKRERLSVYILLCIIFASIFVPYFYRKQFNPPVVDPLLQQQLNALLKEDSANAINSFTTTGNETFSPEKTVAQLFNFDPNTLDAEGFKKLGLRDKTINTLINYRNKGGRFTKPEDIRKIYGLRQEEADRLIPYVKINASANKTTDTKSIEQPAYTSRVISKIDINTATEEEFKSLPGIGDVLSKRIVKFRNSINGFESIDDLRKTYGLPDSTFQKILPMLTISQKNQ